MLTKKEGEGGGHTAIDKKVNGCGSKILIFQNWPLIDHLIKF